MISLLKSATFRVTVLRRFADLSRGGVVKVTAEGLTAVGGKRYAPYSMVISSDEWQAHYGPEVWRRLVAAKAKYDPNRVLSPHPAIFGEK